MDGWSQTRWRSGASLLTGVLAELAAAAGEMNMQAAVCLYSTK